MELKHEWAVILAGGDGTRLKSLTRRITGDERPKQFCPVMGDMTLVEETQKRVAFELPKERMLFLLNRLHEPYYVNILNDTPTSNLIEQPRNIGTAPAILYSVLKIAAVDPQAIIGFFPSDHYVSDNTKFMAHIRSAFETAHVGPDLVILLGIEPASPETDSLVPERLAVLKVTGIKWSDLGEPNRVLASIRLAGLRPPWMENY